jgi:hypothetical protein
MHPATRKALEPTAALLERAYRLALALQPAQARAKPRKVLGEKARISQELLSVLDDARVSLLAANASTPPDPSATLPSA